jgi:hypothetical protein
VRDGFDHEVIEDEVSQLLQVFWQIYRAHIHKRAKDASSTKYRIYIGATIMTCPVGPKLVGREYGNWGGHRMMSVTANHVVFVLSFASAFFVCYVGSQFLSSVLNDAGYDLFGTILGHEKQPENMSRS